jgi:hypothetical protein
LDKFAYKAERRFQKGALAGQSSSQSLAAFAELLMQIAAIKRMQEKKDVRSTNGHSDGFM